MKYAQQDFIDAANQIKDGSLTVDIPMMLLQAAAELSEVRESVDTILKTLDADLTVSAKYETKDCLRYINALVITLMKLKEDQGLLAKPARTQKTESLDAPSNDLLLEFRGLLDMMDYWLPDKKQIDVPQTIWNRWQSLYRAVRIKLKALNLAQSKLAVQNSDVVNLAIDLGMNCAGRYDWNEYFDWIRKHTSSGMTKLYQPQVGAVRDSFVETWSGVEPVNIAECLVMLDKWSEGAMTFSAKAAGDIAYAIRATFNPLQWGCKMPPKGWRCDRGFNHDGPCAAYQEV